MRTRGLPSQRRQPERLAPGGHERRRDRGQPGRAPRADAVDRELLALLNRRADLALAVGEIKKHEGSVVFRPAREAQVIDALKEVNPGPLQTPSIAPI